jgi:hypothetical protein
VPDTSKRTLEDLVLYFLNWIPAAAGMTGYSCRQSYKLFEDRYISLKT